jgi:PAS domain S-box-containing protein
MLREEYIQREIDRSVQFWLGWTMFSAALFFFVISALDYIAAPDKFFDFLKIRSFGAVICIIVSIINRKKIDRNFQLVLIYISLIVSVGCIEYMVVNFGGHTSTYYAGFFLVAVYAIGFIPLDLKHSLFITIICFLIYSIPILAIDDLINYRYFIMPLFFLFSTYASLIIWRYVSQQRLIRELGLQYDIEQQKKQLELYSHKLEDLVAERTKDLRKSEQWHRSVFDNATDGIAIMNREGIIVNVNDKVCELHGFPREMLVGTHVKLLENESHRESSAERMVRILNGEALIYETIHNRKDGSPVNIEVSAKLIIIGEELWIQAFYRDITEKKKLQEHLFQSQKMESIGVLAGGIAHDFNNMLTAVLGHTEVIRYHSSLDPKALRSLQVIEDASRKAGGMISQLLGFARKSSFRLIPVSMNDVVQDTIKLLERVIDKNIVINTALDERLPFIDGDSNQLSQVVMNLIVNARDAMPQGGRIEIASRSFEVTPGTTDVPAYIQPGVYVHVSIADTGAGIPEHILQKVFEPFFTTKEQGKGTGLGLSMAYGAIKEHGGYITVLSRLGAGTTFNLLIPVAKTASAVLKSDEFPESLRGTETIMFVDDEEHVLSSVTETLSTNGYKVIAINDPAAAVDQFKLKAADIALVISDMVMPNVDGQDLIRRLRAVKPEVKILAVSGFVKYVSKNEDVREVAGFLQKPFETRQLLTTIRRILDPIPRPPITT